MTAFRPDGYVTTGEAIVRATLYFFPEQIAAAERAQEATGTKPDNFADAVARAFMQSQVPNALRREFKDIVKQTVHRLRNFLHQGKLNAYYFDTYGRQSVPQSLWATANADGAIESGIFKLFGQLFLLQSELDALLIKQQAEKRPLPKAKIPELTAALRKLEDLPRAAQLEALRDMPEFSEFTITHAVFRDAKKQAGLRRPGRKSRRQS